MPTNMEAYMDDKAFETFAQLHPDEAHAKWPRRFWRYFQKQCPEKTTIDKHGAGTVQGIHAVQTEDKTPCSLIFNRPNPPNSKWWGGWFERSDEWRDKIGLG